MEVRQTGDLSYFSLFLPLEPSEVQRKSNRSPSDWPVRPVRRFSASRWLHRTFTGLGPDRQRNLVKSDGIHWKSDRLSAGSVGIGRVQWKSVGIRRKRGGSVKYTKNLASTMKAPIMWIAWISWISFTIHFPWFIEMIDRVALDALLGETWEFSNKKKLKHPTFDFVGCKVDTVDGAAGSVLESASSSALRWRFFGHAGCFPAAFEVRFWPAGMVFDGKESASYD